MQVGGTHRGPGRPIQNPLCAALSAVSASVVDGVSSEASKSGVLGSNVSYDCLCEQNAEPPKRTPGGPYEHCAFAAADGAALGAMSLMRGVAKADGGAADD